MFTHSCRPNLQGLEAPDQPVSAISWNAFNDLRSSSGRAYYSLYATVNVVPEDASHVLQACCSHLAGKLDGTSRHHLHHIAAVAVFAFLHHRNMNRRQEWWVRAGILIFMHECGVTCI